MTTLNFDNNRTTIDVQTLKNTVRYEMANGKLPKNRPVEHFQFIEELSETALSNGLVITEPQICASERQAMRLNWVGKPKDECPLENYLLQRLMFSFQIENLGDNDKTMKFAGAYNEKGLQIAYGVNVFACSNMQVFGDYTFKTFGKNKKPYEEIIINARTWCENARDIENEQYQKIEALKAVQLEKPQINEVLGDLFTMAVEDNNNLAQIQAPLNQAQVADLVKYSHDELYKSRGVNAYDLVQHGTHGLKPESSDLVSLIDHNTNFCNYMTERFLN